MTTSGSIDFTVTTNEICTEALELLGVLGEGEYPNQDQLCSSQRTLNMLAKNWQAEGLNLFAVQRTWLFPEKYENQYDLVKAASTGTVSSSTAELANIYTNEAFTSGTSLEVVMASGSGNNRKVILAVTKSNAVGDLEIEGVAGTFIDGTDSEGDDIAMYEWLDTDLPATAGTYDLTFTGASDAALFVLYADGFTQISASDSNVVTPTPDTEISGSVTPTTSNYLVMSMGVSFYGGPAGASSQMHEGSGQTGFFDTPAETDSASTSAQASYTINSGTTHSYTMGETIGDFIIASFEVSGVSSQTAAPNSTRYVKNYYELTVAADAAATDTTLTLTDNEALTLFEDDDNVGVHLDDKTIHWTTATLSGTTLTLTDSLPSAVTAGKGIYGYTFSTDAANRPMNILEGYTELYQGIDEKSTVPVDQLSRVDYYTLNDKNQLGRVNQFYYDPQIGTGKLYIWPTPEDERDVLFLLVQRTLDDFDNQNDCPDFPQEWYMPLAYNLAKYLAPKYGTPQMDYTRIYALADELYTRAKEFDTEMYTSTYFRPEDRYCW